MSLPIRQTGHLQQVAGLRFVDQKTAPATTTDPTIYRVGDVLYLRTAAGNVQQLVGVQTGQTTLVAGTKTINTGIYVSAASKVYIQLRTGGGTMGTHYRVSALTEGAPGTGAFTVSAVDTSGALVNTDISVVDWTIFG